MPSLLQTYRPMNPVAPKTVATTPLKLDRPPVPLLSDDKLVVFNSLGASVEYFAFKQTTPNAPDCCSAKRIKITNKVK